MVKGINGNLTKIAGSLETMEKYGLIAVLAP